MVCMDEQQELHENSMTHIQELLEENLALVKENNHLLRKMQRAKTMESLRGVLRIGAMVAVAIVAYMFLKPYILGAKKIYTQVGDQIETISNTAKDLNEAKGKLENTQEKVNDFFKGFNTGVN